ncbi:Uncharacterised protein [Serratia plymuthica]|uniref:Uncharacterized protein n=1 Tax=Serratia plymuthica TaxID=82996 RepID=A0A2X4X019_SERPL|nr:Uncharacterised protein [Serratia plymuthica]
MLADYRYKKSRYGYYATLCLRYDPRLIPFLEILYERKSLNSRGTRRLAAVVACSQHQPALIAELFSEDYRQQVDGKVLDYAQFMQHMALLKQLTRSMALEIIAVAGQGRRY